MRPRPVDDVEAGGEALDADPRQAGAADGHAGTGAGAADMLNSVR
ncbi:hypothetical protein [Streptomyces afghaniensis]|nr:hypothetical protein [Streptomyces afghaniensis]MDQ1014481.1 hypothetical protein [Streptomyces afghaniensis]